MALGNDTEWKIEFLRGMAEDNDNNIKREQEQAARFREDANRMERQLLVAKAMEL